MDRLGVADDLVAHGVTWQRGKVFHRDAPVFEFDLLPESDHKRPAFINLQQFHFEAACLAAVERTGLVDVRWGHEVAAISARPDGVRLEIATPEGAYNLTADWLVAADGARELVLGGAAMDGDRDDADVREHAREVGRAGEARVIVGGVPAEADLAGEGDRQRRSS